MKMKFLIIAIITLFSLFHTIKSEPFSCQLVSGPSSFKLVVQWPNSVCNTDHSVLTSCKRPIPQRFTIRGLWAFDGSGKSTPYCDYGTLLSKKEVDYKRYELEHEWPNLFGADYEFWSKEWRRHGRCLSGMTPKLYFDTAIDIMEEVGSLLELLNGKGMSKHERMLQEWKKQGRRLSGLTPKLCFHTTIDIMEEVGFLLEVLNAKGLSPNTNQLYVTRNFPIAIHNQIDAITEIKCNTDLHGRSQLHEVFFCASTHGVLLNCSNNARNEYKSRNCPSNILFPSEPPAPALSLTAPTLAISARLNFRALIIVSLYVFGDDEGGYAVYITFTSIPK